MKQIRWGILGCGKIANKFAADLRLVEGATCYGAASLQPGRAKAFADEHGFLHAFESYEALCQSEVDVIYIATPHGLHYAHARLCLENGKAVLCEKAFTLNEKDTRALVELARAQKVFLMEAFWTRFIPQFLKLQELLASGAIGEIRTITADFGFKSPEPKPQRLWDPVIGGGSLLDVGIYPVFLATNLLGEPDEVAAVMSPYDTGVDEQISMSLRFKSGAVASLYSSFAADTPVEAVITGTNGSIRLANRFHNPTSRIFLTREGADADEVPVHRESGYGYQFEARHVQECLEKGLNESPVLSLDDSLRLMRTLDRIRAACGIRYPADS